MACASGERGVCGVCGVCGVRKGEVDVFCALLAFFCAGNAEVAVLVVVGLVLSGACTERGLTSLLLLAVLFFSTALGSPEVFSGLFGSDIVFSLNLGVIAAQEL